MPLNTTLAGLSQNPALNGLAGTDLPSQIDDQLRYALAFIAQLRDGAGFTTGLNAGGQCRLIKSGSNLLLLPYNGNGLSINGTMCSIPAAGVSLAPTGLTPGTVYNIYAVATAGAVSSLEAATTARATSSSTGMEIKTGDATRTLVGKVRIIAGPAFADTDEQRFIINWFNRRPLRIYTTNALAQNSTTSAVASLAPLMEFLTWGDAIPASFIAGVSNSAANSITATALGLNTQGAFSHTVANYQAYANGSNGVASGGTTFVPGEGYSYISLNGNVSGGTGTWASALEASGVIQG